MSEAALAPAAPIPGWAKAAIDDWTEAAGITDGRLFRAVDKAGRVTGETLSAQAVYLVITGRARKIGLELAPHDARRIFAKLAHKGKAPTESSSRLCANSQPKTAPGNTNPGK
jgi:hypothetical protein